MERNELELVAKVTLLALDGDLHLAAVRAMELPSDGQGDARDLIRATLGDEIGADFDRRLRSLRQDLMAEGFVDRDGWRAPDIGDETRYSAYLRHHSDDPRDWR